MRSLVNRWSPPTHTTHCMTTSWPAAATEMRVRVSPAVQPRYFYALCPSCHNPPYFQACGIHNTDKWTKTNIVSHVLDAASLGTVETRPNVGLFVGHRLVLLNITLAQQITTTVRRHSRSLATYSKQISSFYTVNALDWEEMRGTLRIPQ